ncbi:hypothetical protein T265_05021, partial [Opisthorchis viverrini]
WLRSQETASTNVIWPRPQIWQFQTRLLTRTVLSKYSLKSRIKRRKERNQKRTTGEHIQWNSPGC